MAKTPQKTPIFMRINAHSCDLHAKRFPLPPFPLPSPLMVPPIPPSFTPLLSPHGKTNRFPFFIPQPFRVFFSSRTRKEKRIKTSKCENMKNMQHPSQIVDLTQSILPPKKKNRPPPSPTHPPIHHVTQNETTRNSPKPAPHMHANLPTKPTHPGNTSSQPPTVFAIG